MIARALLTAGHNVRAIQREIDAQELGTRMFSRGAAEDGWYMTMADHRWPVLAIDGKIVTIGGDLGGNPIRFANQVDGLYARKYATSAQWLVLSCDPALQQIELEDVPDTLEPGDLIQFREGAACGIPGAELLYVDRPSSALEYSGHWERHVERPDIPNVDNIAPNAWIEHWATYTPGIGLGVTFPVGWAWPRQSTTRTMFLQEPERRQFGHYSLRVICGGDIGRPLPVGWAGEVSDVPGMETEWIDVHPSAARPHYTFQAAFWIVQGKLRMEIVVDTVGDGSHTITIPDPDLRVVDDPQGRADVRSNVFRQLNIWTFAGIGGLNFWDDADIGAVKRVKLRLRPEETDFFEQNSKIEFYIDAVQITNTAAGSDVWYDRIASNALWHAALDELDFVGEPMLRFDVQPLDLFREDPDAFEHNELFRGGRVLVHDTRLGAHIRTRIQALPARDLTETGQVVTQITLANKERKLTRDVNRVSRPRTPVPVQPAHGDVDTSSQGGALSNLRVEVVDGGAALLLLWAHNHAVQDDSRFSITISSTIDGELVSGRDPRMEENDASVVDRVGSYRYEIAASSPGAGEWRVNVITVQLFDDGTPAGTYQTSHAGWYPAAE